MPAETIDHVTLSRLAEAGAVQSARVVGRPGGWTVRVRYAQAERTLAAQRSRQARVFRRMETLVSYLKGIGIPQFEVDAAEYEPEAGGQARPDRADALRRTHEAAAYDAWFREQVEIALREADDPDTEWVSNEEVQEDWARQRAELLARVAAGDKS